MLAGMVSVPWGETNQPITWWPMAPTGSCYSALLPAPELNWIYPQQCSVLKSTLSWRRTAPWMIAWAQGTGSTGAEGQEVIGQCIEVIYRMNSQSNIWKWPSENLKGWLWFSWDPRKAIATGLRMSIVLWVPDDPKLSPLGMGVLLAPPTTKNNNWWWWQLRKFRWSYEKQWWWGCYGCLVAVATLCAAVGPAATFHSV